MFLYRVQIIVPKSTCGRHIAFEYSSLSLCSHSFFTPSVISGKHSTNSVLNQQPGSCLGPILCCSWIH